jgi:hypothetical protein
MNRVVAYSASPTMIGADSLQRSHPRENLAVLFVRSVLPADELRCQRDELRMIGMHQRPLQHLVVVLHMTVGLVPSQSVRTRDALAVELL